MLSLIFVITKGLLSGCECVLRHLVLYIRIPLTVVHVNTLVYFFTRGRLLDNGTIDIIVSPLNMQLKE
jgi:hypothetical protein